MNPSVMSSTIDLGNLERRFSMVVGYLSLAAGAFGMAWMVFGH